MEINMSVTKAAQPSNCILNAGGGVLCFRRSRFAWKGQSPEAALPRVAPARMRGSVCLNLEFSRGGQGRGPVGIPLPEARRVRGGWCFSDGLFPLSQSELPRMKA